MQQEFFDALAKTGIPASTDLILDGKFRRYHVQGDKRGRRNGWYRYVQVTPDYAWGVFGCNKRNISGKFNNKEASAVTAYERKEKRRQEYQIKAEEETLHSRAAKKANNMWGWLKPAVKHPYADLKSIGLYGVRQLNSSLVIPVYFENYIVSLQFISLEGNKRYLTGGKKQGGYFWIGKDDSDTFYIAEGYATAASVYEATNAHTIIAFDAGNIPHIAKMLRNKNPDKKIVIAADNDQWTKGNPGYSKAQEASALIGAEIRLPPFSFEDKSQPTDWNDYHRRYGLAALAKELMGITVRQEIQVAPEEAIWRQQLIEGKQELPGFRNFDGKSKENAYLFLAHHPFFKDMVAYNTFSSRLVFTRPPAWEVAAGFVIRPIENRDYFNATRALERYFIKIAKEVVQDAWEALGETRKINPPRDYLEAIEWDKTPRLDRWLTYYLGAERQNPEYLALIGSKWIMGAVSRIYNPGEKFDNVLILEGGQDNKKSMLFEKFTTFREEPYFLDFAGDINKQDSLGMMQGKIVVEMSELASMNKAVIEEMKGFVTRKKDTFRPAWGKTILERKRVFVLAATTNNDSSDGYLVDPTGNRRYWPVGCGNFDLEALGRDKDQLWAEAVYRWKDGERTWLESDEEKELAKLEQSERQYEDGWLQPIEYYLQGKMETDVYRICKEAIGLSGEQIRKNTEDRARKCLKKLGWERSPTRPRTENGRITLWIRKAA